MVDLLSHLRVYKEFSLPLHQTLFILWKEYEAIYVKFLFCLRSWTSDFRHSTCETQAFKASTVGLSRQ
jgi:hypothetical protein